ncbi:hypothetical protein SNE40_015315 [Patella caerulea]|uniref:Uncharacterized protein n=2 Tax=Patella caerulea TaxID=87958 RepID=A0AAN8JJS9_PATCE
MQLPYPVAHYTYFHGNYLGNINFIWKLPPEDERSDDKTVKTVQQISEYIPTFSTQYIRQQFLNKYVQATNSPKAVLRNLYRFLTNDCSSAETEDQEVIDKRVEEVISLQDPELTWDLRKMNGNARNSKFDIFWTELDNYFNEINLAVHERRHGQHMYLPYAISIEDLVSIIKKRLPENTPIPSNEWVRLQFWPTNPNTITALRYTARFEVKFTIQSRQIRGQHEDSHYVAVQLQYIKAFAVKYREFTDFLWIDDKAIVPIGEPGLPVSTGVRPHNHSLAPKSGPSISALDHDYNVCGAIPSVTFKCDILEAASSSFFNGIAFVTVKDKVFSPSNAIRHGCETTNILRTHYSQDDTQVNAEHPILIMYTDGGPDHRTTFGSVQIAAICMFMWLDLDFLITARTAPMGSWANLAERVNSNLNLALQNVSLSREHMTDNVEMKMRGINSLKAARDTARRYPAFKEGLIQSVAPVIELLQERFGHLKLKGEPIVISPSANQESIDDFFKIVKDLIDQNLIENKLTKTDLEKSATLQDFMKKHCRLRNYTFQIKKCANALIENCAYCLFNPPRLPDEVFDTLSFVPDPVVASNNKYESFETVYGQATNDLARPSLMLSSQNKEIDKKNRKILNATKVRDAVLCVECGKPRGVYSETKLTYIEKQAVDRLKELNSFTCGSPLFPHSSKYNSSIIVREGLRCCSTMETTYYSKSTVSLPAVCFHCGVAKSSDFAADQNIQSLQAQYSVVRPICVKCKDDGKEAIVRGKRNVKRLRKM